MADERTLEPCPRHRRYWVECPTTYGRGGAMRTRLVCPCGCLIGVRAVTITAGPRGGVRRHEETTWARP